MSRKLLGWLLISMSILFVISPLVIFIVSWVVPMSKLGSLAPVVFFWFNTLFNNAFLFEWSMAIFQFLLAVGLFFLGIRELKRVKEVLSN